MERFTKVVLALLVCLTTIVAQAQEDGFKSPSLLHNNGMQSAGVRAGHGTKNKINYGVGWMMCFNSKMSIEVEVDRETAVFGYTDFTNYFLVGAGMN